MLDIQAGHVDSLVCRLPCLLTKTCALQLGGFAFIGEGIPVGLGAAYRIKYAKVGPSCHACPSQQLRCLCASLHIC